MIIKDNQTRAELLDISIEETNNEIFEIQNLIQQLEETKRDITDDDFKADFQTLIQKCESKIDYLEGLKESDLEILNKLNCCLNTKE